MQVYWWQIILSFLSSFLLKYNFCFCHFHCIWDSRLTFFLTQICLVFAEKFAVILRFVPLWVMCFFLCLLRFFFLSPILSVWLWSSFGVYLAWVLLNFLDLWIYSFYPIWKNFDHYISSYIFSVLVLHRDISYIHYRPFDINPEVIEVCSYYLIIFISVHHFGWILLLFLQVINLYFYSV